MSSFYIANKPENDTDMLIAKEISKDSSIMDKRPKYGKNVYVKTDSIRVSGEITPTEGYKFTPVLAIKPKEKNLVSAYISGSSGSGKSVVVNHLVREVLKDKRFTNLEYETSDGPVKEKKARVFLISAQKTPDPAFQSFKYSAFDIHNRQFLQVDYRSFVNKVIIFDDVSSLANPVLEKHINGLINSLLENSRKNNNCIICVNHQSQDYAKSKKMISEAENWVVFPGLNSHMTERFLDSYLGLSDSLLDEIFELDTRSLLVHRSNPQYFISDVKIMANERKRRTKKEN